MTVSQRQCRCGPAGTASAERAQVYEAVMRLTASGATFVAAKSQYGVTMPGPKGNEFDVQ